MLEARYFGQSLKTWLVAIGLVVVLAVVLNVLKRLAQRKLRSWAQEDNGDERTFRLFHLVATFISEIQVYTIVLISAYLATSILDVPPKLEKLFDRVVLGMFVIQVGVWGNKLILFWVENWVAPDGQTPSERSTLKGIVRFVSRLVLFTVLTLLTLHNFGIDVTTLIAGLSIGGVSFAFAFKTILEDLFGSMTIALDKPFLVGDAIRVDNESGVVQYVGLKTTRIKSTDGEQVIFSNADLLRSRIHNFKRQPDRRVVQRFGVSYSTSAAQLKEIPDIVRDIVTRQPMIKLDRIHLMGLGEQDLKFELVYLVPVADYILHMDLQQQILLEIYGQFEQRGIAFAHPMQNMEILRLGKGLKLPPSADSDALS